MTRAQVRYYLHNLEGLKLEIAEINAELEQYRAMTTDEFVFNRVDMDPDPYKDKPAPLPAYETESQESFSNTVIKPSGAHYNDNSDVESLVVKRVSFIERQETKLFGLRNILSAINCTIYYLETKDRQLIQWRYFEHRPWWKVAKDLHYDRDTCRHHDQKICDDIIGNYNARIK